MLSESLYFSMILILLCSWNKSSSLRGSPLVQPIPLLDRLVKEGRLGRKSGKGVYDYSEETKK